MTTAEIDPPPTAITENKAQDANKSDSEDFATAIMNMIFDGKNADRNIKGSQLKGDQEIKQAIAKALDYGKSMTVKDYKETTDGLLELCRNR